MKLTNKETCELVSVESLDPKDANEFDYIEGEDRFSYRIFKYRDSYYDAFDMMTTRQGPFNFGLPKEFQDYDAYQSDSFFSGILIKFDPEDENVTVVTYIAE